jgi:hypothetical protein
VKIPFVFIILLINILNCRVQAGDPTGFLDAEFRKLGLVVADREQVDNGTTLQLKELSGSGTYSLDLLSFDNVEAAQKKFRQQANRMMNLAVLAPPSKLGDESVFRGSDSFWAAAIRADKVVLVIHAQQVSFDAGGKVVADFIRSIEAQRQQP